MKIFSFLVRFILDDLLFADFYVSLLKNVKLNIFSYVVCRKIHQLRKNQ